MSTDVLENDDSVLLTVLETPRGTLPLTPPFSGTLSGTPGLLTVRLSRESFKSPEALSTRDFHLRGATS